MLELETVTARQLMIPRREIAAVDVSAEGQDTVEITAGGKLKISASMTETSVSIARFSGLLECDILKANTVMGASYTPGAGNIW